jgi:hypothetical protein
LPTTANSFWEHLWKIIDDLKEKMKKEEKILCKTPTPGEKPIRIDQWKYDPVRGAILRAFPQKGDGFLFKDLSGTVDKFFPKDF